MTFELSLIRKTNVKNFINYNKSIPQGLTSAIVTVNKETNKYMVLATTSWQTDFWISVKTADSFTANFSVAAPANAFIDYMVVCA